MDKREREALRERLKAQDGTWMPVLPRDSILALLDLADERDRLLSWAERARGVLEEAAAEYDAGMAHVTNANYDDAAGLGSDLREALAALLADPADEEPAWTREWHSFDVPVGTWTPTCIPPGTATKVTFVMPPDPHNWRLTTGDTHWRCPKCGGAVLNGEALPFGGCEARRLAGDKEPE